MNAREGEYPWHLPFAEAIKMLRPGEWDARVLDQRGVWVDSAAVVHEIGELEDAHLANIVAMLRRNATRLMVDHELAPGRAGRCGGRSPVLDAATPVSVRTALGWLEYTPLWEALQDELGRRGLTAPGATTEIDEPVGRWAVRTHNAVYIVDLDTSRVLRLPEPGAGPLRADQAWAPLHDLGRVRLGLELHLVITVTPGVRTTRTTTPVTGIHRLPATLSGTDLIDRARSVWGPAPVDPQLTEYRTVELLHTADAVCDCWAGLARVLHQAAVRAPVLIVPRRLRRPDVDSGAADLCLTGPTPDDRTALQASVDDVVGFHLRVTAPADYPVDPSPHAVAFGPTTPRTGP